MNTIELPDVTVPIGIEKLNHIFCGCGCPEKVWQVVLDELKRLEDPKRFDNAPEWGGLNWLLVYVLDYCELTNHGGNCMGAWCEAEGIEASEFLETHGVEWENSMRPRFVNSKGVLLSRPA